MNEEVSFGTYVRQRRREMDLTQEELARRVGCAAITLRKIEAEDLRASVQIAERLALALALPLEERAEFVRRARAVRPESFELPPVTPPPSMEEIGREDLTGRAIRGYALAERIGTGGMGTVYRAVQPNVEREVAVKIILPAFANHPDFIRRFEAEAQLVARLEHPHIVPLYDYWREPGVAYLVMRLLRGGNIQNLLAQGPLPIDITAHMLDQICSALNAAHRIDVIHRDLKPANVLLDEDHNAYLADFGIAKNLGNPDVENQTQMDAIIGSPQYMSPEQIRSLSIRPQTDIYCLGVMLYEILTGSLPFSGPTPFDMIQQHINTPMPPLSARKAGLPAGLDAVITRATAKNPDERYSDALSFLNDFRQVVGRLVEPYTVAIAYEEDDTEIEIANPFKGLRAFSEADAENFFGRETLIQQLLARLSEGGDLSRFLAVIGPSGSGKSSVVRAGLIPALRRGGLPGSENWFTVDMLPGKHPFEELEASLLRLAVNPPQSLLSQLRDGNRGLLRAVHRILPADETVELVLVIDQFEEVFTLVEDEAERALLLESIATAVMDERSRLRVVITLRADFTDKPLRYLDFGELMHRRFEFVLPLIADEVERAVAGPAQRAGLRLERGLVSTIIRETGNQPGTLPLLQHALSELFERRDGRTLTNKAYRQIGGVLGALVRSAEVIYALLDKTGQITTRQLFLRLVTLGEGTEDTRRRVLREELEGLSANDDGLSVVIGAFGRARLLTLDHDPITRGATIEVAHEALLREWNRLREWLSESRADVRMQRQLATAAREWENAGHDESFLITGSRLEQFEGWSANTPVALTQHERAFLDVSIAERNRRASEEGARQRRELEAAKELAETQRQSASRLRVRNRVITTVASVAVILALLAGLLGLRAENEKQLATSRELAAAAVSNLDIDPERSILLALQAESAAHTIEAENALHRSIPEARVLFVLHHGAKVWEVAYSPDGKRIATTGGDKTAKIWDANTGELLMTLTGHADEVTAISFSPDGRRVATSSDDQTVKIWDSNNGQLLSTLAGHNDRVNGIEFSSDGTRLITASNDKTAIIWEIATGKELLSLTDSNGAVGDVAFSPDGKRVATIADGMVRVWDAGSGKELLSLPVEDSPSLIGVSFSPDGARIASVGGNQYPYLRVWDAATGQVLLNSDLGHSSAINRIVFSSDGTLAATASDDQKAKVWDSATGRVLYTLSGHTNIVFGAAFSPDGTRLVTGSWDGTARVWDITPPREVLFIPFADAESSNWTWWLTYSPDGKRILTDYTDGDARIWDAYSGKELLQLKGPALYTTYSWDGKLAASGNYENTVIVWDAHTGKQLTALVGHENLVLQVFFSPDGTRLASTSANGDLIIWDWANGKAVFTLHEFGDVVTSVSYSPDGKHLVAGGGTGESGYGVIIDAIKGEKAFTLPIDGFLGAVGYSRDGKQVALSSLAGTVSIWDALTGKQLLTLHGHQGWVYAVAFSLDGRLLATASADGTTRLWDTTTGVNVLTLNVDSRGTGGVEFSPDGKHLAVGGKSGIYIFLLPIEDVIALAKSRVTRSLTLEECQQYLHVEQCPAEPRYVKRNLR
jgi:WD40 repeat protein/transcriptional regulator with XRE-family HTH domain